MAVWKDTHWGKTKHFNFNDMLQNFWESYNTDVSMILYFSLIVKVHVAHLFLDHKIFFCEKSFQGLSV